MKRVTLQDVATHAGVSMKTVSNVVRDYQHVSPAMRERVRIAIDELGYRPNLRGRSLATGRSSMLALAFPDLRWPYFAELAHLFARVCAERGYRLLLEETGGTREGELAVLRDRDAGIVDGIVLHPQALSAGELTEHGEETPMVLLGEAPQPPGVDQVAIDNVAAAGEAVAHLARSGRRRIAFLGHETEELSHTSRLRIEGYRRGLERAGLPVDDELLVPRPAGDALGAEEALGAALDRGLRVDALLCRDDHAAIGAVRALHLRGLDVPGDVAVVGWDATVLTASTTPSITSIAPDTAALAARTLDLLLERIEGLDSPGRLVTVGHDLLVRESAPDPDDARP
ncbi:LacI family transcriptional regulator [Isoptericola sp. 4D.3]|uniref:LacI family transcriptional regulator n=1 Tax=Isoptericola peretonis TaxID=2918523 RepID=A0ABT0J3R6_9MICO|nr:LacI family transcriptional regulator [Isoptericola sp. 4D.3]